MSRKSQEQKANDFQSAVSQKRPGFLTEFWCFLRYNKKWWLLPIVILLLILSLLVLVGGTAIAPFLYPLF